MATTTTPPPAATHRPLAATGRDGFAQLLRAEWTKFRSVLRWVLGLLAMIPLTIAFSLLTAAGSGSDLNEHPDELGAIGPAGERVRDALTFVHQPLTGDGSITTRVTGLAAAGGYLHEWAKAGVMIRESTSPGSRYAAVLLTPGHGVRLQANFTTDLAGGAGQTPQWLQLTREGDTITGYESADGTDWSPVGTVELTGLPATVVVGLFTTSPDEVRIETSVGSASAGSIPAPVNATFDNVTVDTGGAPATGGWQVQDTSPGYGGLTEVGGIFTVTGAGDLSPNPPDDDVAQLGLSGVYFGQLAAIAVGVLFITSEYRRRMIWTTFAASPRRGRVLVAKAMVLGGATFVAGLVASLLAFLLAQPVLRGNGFGPPGYPIPSLADWPVLRAVVGAAALLALVAVLGLALGAILRRSVGAITVLVLTMLASALLIGGLPLAVARWVMRITPAAGLSITQTVDPGPHAAVQPWSMAPPLVGLGVLAAWAVALLAVAVWLTRRRDA